MGGAAEAGRGLRLRVGGEELCRGSVPWKRRFQQWPLWGRETRWARARVWLHGLAERGAWALLGCGPREGYEV